jgi:hypothetical protein
MIQGVGQQFLSSIEHAEIARTVRHQGHNRHQGQRRMKAAELQCGP